MRLAWLFGRLRPGNSGGDFVADPKSGCKVWDPHPVADETVSWSGGCINGLAQGPGSLQWLRGGKALEKDDGEWNMGRQSGRGTQDWNSGSYQGELLGGEPHGQGVMTLQSARYEGEFRNGKPNGEGTVTNLAGRLQRDAGRTGVWRKAKRKITFAVPSSACR